MHRRTFIAAACAAGGLALSAKAQPSVFKLTIARKHSGSDCTSGYLAVNGSVIAYTPEKPWLGNAPLISSIPDGVYGGILRYGHADKWRIELTGGGLEL